MIALLAALNVFPQFARYLRAFGIKNFPRDESLGGFDSHLEIDDASARVLALGMQPRWESDQGVRGVRTGVESIDEATSAASGSDCSTSHSSLKQTWLTSIISRGDEIESCYLLKYFEPKDPFDEDPSSWSIRQLLVYQKVHLDPNSKSSPCSDHIVLRPSQAMAKRLGRAIKSTEETRRQFIDDWTKLHTLLISTLEDGLRDHINHLDAKITVLVRERQHLSR